MFFKTSHNGRKLKKKRAYEFELSLYLEITESQCERDWKVPLKDTLSSG